MIKKYKVKSAIFIAFMLAGFMIPTSCSNLSQEPAVSPVYPAISGSAAGNFSIAGAAQQTRSAFPSIPTGASISYYAEVTDTDETSPRTFGGNVTFDYPSYEITGLDFGVLWKIEIGVKDGSDKILKDTHVMSTALSAVNSVYSHDFELKPFQTVTTPAGTGNIELEIEFESGSGITKGIMHRGNSNYVFTAGSNKVVIANTDVYSGSYVCDFSLQNASEVLYSFTETVNVYDNMTTNTWVRNGGTVSSPYLVEETLPGGDTVIKCKITNDMIAENKLRTIYVSESGLATGKGSFFSPVDSINTAITKMDNKNVDYTIYVIGSIVGTQLIPSTLTLDDSEDYHAKSLTICGYTGLDENNLPQDRINANLTSGSPSASGTALTIQTEVPVTIRNLEITGGNSSDIGGGIYLSQYADVTLKSGVVVDNNSAGWGGGVFIDGGDTAGVYGKLKIDGAKITHNISTSENSHSPEYYYAGGGGVYCRCAEVKFSSGEISYNTAKIAGGGIYNYSNGSVKAGKVFVYGNSTIKNNECIETANGSAAGIMNSGSSYLYLGYSEDSVTQEWTGSITQNHAKKYSALVHSDSGARLYFNSGSIKDNPYDLEEYGAVGISGFNNVFFNMSGSAYIAPSDIVCLNVSGDNAAYITVTGTLLPPSEANGIVATIRPTNYSKQAVKASGAGVDLAVESKKFRIVSSIDSTDFYKCLPTGFPVKLLGSKYKPDAVGDIVYNDGSADPASIASIDSTRQERAISVICYITTDKILGISLKEVYNKVWCVNALYATAAFVGTNSDDGMYNLEKLKEYILAYPEQAYSESLYPAFWWAENYSATATNLEDYATGWYLPAKNELYNWCSDFATVNASMNKIGTTYADPFVYNANGNYLTSTEQGEENTFYVYAVRFYNSQVYTKGKRQDSYYYVRAVRNFIDD